MSNRLYSNLEWLPQAPENFVSRCRSAMDHGEGLGTRLQALASCRLDHNQLCRLARIIGDARQAGRGLAPLAPFRLGLLSNSTTDFMEPALVATAARHGISLEIFKADYNQIVQEAVSPDSAINRACPDAVLLAIDYRGLPLKCAVENAPTAEPAVQASWELLETIRSGIRRNGRAVCIFQTLAAPAETVLGGIDRVLSDSLLARIEELNGAIARGISGTADALLDVAHLARTVGLADWHSPKEWSLARIPFSSTFLPLYAEHACRVITALRGKSRRCLVLDLDNTIWGGVIGDDGLQGIQIAQGDPTGEAYLSVQRMALELRQRGIVLAVCSKNEDETARLPFREHPEMLLREKHIAVFQANWNDKPANLRAISGALSLGLESMVLLDDNPAERSLVRQVLPEVAVPELPGDPALIARTLSAGGYFECVALSREDFQRADFYQGNALRVILQKQTGDLETYLKSLNMEFTFQPFDEAGRARIAQLINKSNQFNLTTRRYNEGELTLIERDPACFTLQIRLCDNFGDNGMISVVICREKSNREWDIDTWLMSCRVLGRKVENTVLGNILEHAKKRGIRKLTGTYIPTGRNKLVADHYGKLGFTQVRAAEDGIKTYELEVESLEMPSPEFLPRSEA